MRWTALAVTVVALSLSGCKRDGAARLREMAAQGVAHDELSRPIPIFSVRDLKSSERYYRDALGFKVDWEYGEPPDFGSVTRAATTIFLCQGCEEPGGSWVIVFAADVDRLHRELQGKGAIIKHPPTDEPWKLREMQVADPDGNVIRFATSTEH
jgi:catechol 2,3-dioxygenase-like lactoylglutathione lyase family enzyme